MPDYCRKNKIITFLCGYIAKVCFLCENSDMIIDDVLVKIKGGDGGRGAVAFNKNLMELGPVGGSGGDGGSVYAEGSSDITVLNQFRFKKKIEAEDGEDGKAQFRDGKRGDDLVIKVPVGTVMHNLTTEEDEDITRVGQRVRIARGGRGGKGNFLFRSSTNTSPQEFEEGTLGDVYEFRFELKYIADVGIIGLPNVGKSSLLNELTHAKSKVANYQFTTLEPNLGTYYELILADVPGLIEGASQGKGLGDRFLRHIERTKILFHLVSAESDDVWRDYHVVRDELIAYNAVLGKKEEYIFLSKSDNVSSDDLLKKIAVFKKHKKDIVPLSILDGESIKKVMVTLNRLQEEKIDKI